MRRRCRPGCCCKTTAPTCRYLVGLLASSMVGGRDRVLLDRTLQWDRDHDCAPNGLAHDRSVPARAALARCYASGFGGSSRRSTPSVRRLRSGPPLRQSGASRRAPATSGLPSAPGQTSSRWPARGPPWVSTELTLARTFTHETN